MERMTTQQTLWPCFPLTLPYEVAAPGPSYLVNDYAGVVVSSQVIPCFYNTVIENPNPNQCRRFILDRSLFDLVADHPYLALTDPKLLSWYLSLSPEDRKIIQDEGGFRQFLQRHPALELSKHHVYVKYNADNGALQPTVMSNNHTSIMPRSRMCSCGVSHTDLKLEMLTDNVKENLSMLDCTSRRNGSQKWPCEEIFQTRQLVHLQDGFQTAHNSQQKEEKLKKEKRSQQMSSSSSTVFVCENPATVASFSLDMELERCKQRGTLEHRNQMLVTQDQTCNFTCAEVSPLQSEWSTGDRSSSEYYSFDSIQIDSTMYNDRITVQSAELEQLNCPLDPENSTKEQGQNDAVYDHSYTVDEDDHKANLSTKEQSGNFYSFMEEDQSNLVCVASDGQKSHSASSEIAESDQSVFKRNTEERSTSPVPCPPTCDVMVGTEPELYVSTSTQTEDPKTADKHIVTEVHMADLDYLAGEFLKLKTAQEKLKEKEKYRSSGCKLRSECDCVQRAQRAELSLLTLQYSMCRQHCWILYCITAGGDHLNPVSEDLNLNWPKDPPANILSVLQKLESDYNELREKILEGVPLEQLKPLYVDPEKITTAATYIPAKIVANVHGSMSVHGRVLPRCPQELHTLCTSSGENVCPDNDNTNSCQRQTKQVKKENSHAKRAVTLVPQCRGGIHDACKLAESQTTACKEHTTSEAWFDAEEDLKPAEPAAAPEMSDAMLPFEKHHGSEVSCSALRDDLSEPQPAEAAVRELKGSSMQGHAAHVEHMKRAVGGSQRQASTSISGSETSQDATKPQTLKADCSSAERKFTTQPPPVGSSIKDKQVVCISPTTKGTCVPQHYGTMGSFDTLMTELLQRHPHVGRQRIVDALVELRAKHHGVLSGLPLRTIREMASELLTRPVSATQ